MNKYLKELQGKNLLRDIRYLVTECKRRYLAAAVLVGHFNDDLKKMKETQHYSAGMVVNIVQAIYDRYNKDHCDDQMDIFEPFEETVSRRWHSFIYKIMDALVKNDTFCRCYLKLVDYLPRDINEDAYYAAMQIVQEIDLRWYLSDEPRQMDENEYP